MPQLDFANPLTVAQIVWMFIIFCALYLALRHWALPQVASVIEAREQRILADLDSARVAKEQADAAAAEIAERSRSASAEAQAEIARAVASAKAEAEVAKAETEATKDGIKRVLAEEPEGGESLARGIGSSVAGTGGDGALRRRLVDLL